MCQAMVYTYKGWRFLSIISSSRHTSTDAYHYWQRPSRERYFKLMDYAQFAYFKPPRPEQAIPPDCIQSYEDRGWVGQVKKNGTNNLIFVAPDHALTFRTRHATPHKLWAPTKASSQSFQPLPPFWYVLNAELLHRSQKLRELTFAQRQARGRPQETRGSHG
jgi:hypothetical protein